MSSQDNAEQEDHAQSAHVSDYFRDHSVRRLNENEERDELLAQFLTEYAVEIGIEFSTIAQRRPRVTADTLSSFPVVEGPKLSKSGCAVCLDEFSKEDKSVDVLELPCRHQFHRQCISEWLKEATNCPTCRSDLPTDDALFERFKERQKQKKAMQKDIDELHESMYS